MKKEVSQMRHPLIKEILPDGTWVIRKEDEAATLGDVQYFYHAGNAYTDGVDTKVNIAFILVALSLILDVILAVAVAIG